MRAKIAQLQSLSAHADREQLVTWLKSVAPPPAMQANNDRTGAAVRGMLKLHWLGIDTYQEAVIYMNRDCHVCRAEGFAAQSRVKVMLGERHITATLNIVSTTLLRDDEASLSETAWRALRAEKGARIRVSHPESLGALRAKVYGRSVELPAWRRIIADVVAGHYSDLHLAVLEARDVIAVLRADPGTPEELRERALALAAEVLEFAPRVAPGSGLATARRILESDEAWQKFEAICRALRSPTS